MDKKHAVCKREPFRVILDSTPVLLCIEGARDAWVIVNENATNNVVIGHSGTLATLGMTLLASSGFSDNYTQDEWWGYAPSGSGTVSGFRAIE